MSSVKKNLNNPPFFTYMQTYNRLADKDFSLFSWLFQLFTVRAYNQLHYKFISPGILTPTPNAMIISLKGLSTPNKEMWSSSF